MLPVCKITPAGFVTMLRYVRALRLSMEIRCAVTEQDLDQVRRLFAEYFEWIRAEHGINLGYQGTVAELASLPGVYAEPAGCILLAEIEDEIAGVIALKPLGPGICELKRTFVRPAFRRRGLARLLAERLIDEARARGYHTMRLDTADTMLPAQCLYEALGFRPTQPYYEGPAEIMARARFMAREL